MKEKMEQIFEAMADMTLEMLDKSKGNVLYLEGDELGMVRTTQSLYETLNHANLVVPTMEEAGKNPFTLC